MPVVMNFAASSADMIFFFISGCSTRPAADDDMARRAQFLPMIEAMVEICELRKHYYCREAKLKQDSS